MSSLGWIIGGGLVGLFILCVVMIAREERAETRAAQERLNRPFDLHKAALPDLTVKALDNPRLAALLAEIERGNKRREERNNNS